MSETVQQLKQILVAVEVEKDYADRLVTAAKKGRKYAMLHQDELHARQELALEITSRMSTVESLYASYRRKSRKSKFFIVPKVKLVLLPIEQLIK